MAVHDNYIIIYMVIQTTITENSYNYTYRYKYRIFKVGI